MSAATKKDNAGAVHLVVHAVRPDGTDIYVTATNSAATPSGGVKSRYKPPVDLDVLQKIASLPGLTFR
jgi:hypothetical protein